MRINLSDKLYELAIIAACVGRVNNETYMDLLQKLIDNMDAAEKAEFRRLYTHLYTHPHILHSVVGA